MAQKMVNILEQAKDRLKISLSLGIILFSIGLISLNYFYPLSIVTFILGSGFFVLSYKDYKNLRLIKWHLSRNGKKDYSVNQDQMLKKQK